MKKWVPVMILGGVLMGGGAYWFFSRPYSPRQLVQMLPPDRASHAYVDIGLLREAGILDLIAGSPSLEDDQYRDFVRVTGFDYRKDLDGLAMAFRDGDIYYAAQGRFDWEKIAAYAPSHGGSCEGFACRTPGSVPGRDVSYYMPRNGILAIAVSRNATAGDMVAPGSWEHPPDIGDSPVWYSAPPFVFTDLSSAPDGTRSFLSPLSQAVSTVFTVSAAADDKFELRMVVTTRDSASATKLANDYVETTDLLIRMLARDNMKANSDDLSGVLTGGRFAAKESQVTAVWPISKKFLESLTTLDATEKVGAE